MLLAIPLKTGLVRSSWCHGGASNSASSIAHLAHAIAHQHGQSVFQHDGLNVFRASPANPSLWFCSVLEPFSLLMTSPRGVGLRRGMQRRPLYSSRFSSVTRGRGVMKLIVLMRMIGCGYEACRCASGGAATFRNCSICCRVRIEQIAG